MYLHECFISETLARRKMTNILGHSQNFLGYTVKLGDKKRFDKEQIGVREPTEPALEIFQLMQSPFDWPSP